MSDAIAPLPTFSMITDEEIAAASFLARYRGETRKLYMSDLRIYFSWCAHHGLKPLQVERAHVEFFARYLEEERANMPASVARRLNTLRAFYRIVVADGRMDRDPTTMLKMPKVIFDEARTLGLDRIELGNLIQTARSCSPEKDALITLMGLLGLRVSEACAVKIEDFQDVERGHRVLRVWGKGSKPATIPLPIPVIRTLEKCAGDRTSGYLIRKANGEKQDRMGAYRWVKALAKKAGLPPSTHPHTLRHAAITAALDAGVPLRDAQVFARHSDPRITTRYDRARLNLDRHAAYIVAGYIAGAA